MIRAFFIVCVLIGSSSAVVAQDMMDRVEAAVAATSGIDKVSDEALLEVVPDFGDDLPHEVEPDAAVLEENGQLLAISNTPEGNRYTQFSEKTQEWGPAALDEALLDTADAAVADPEAIIGGDLFSTTSASGDLCTVHSISEAPRFTRTCDRAATVGPEYCTDDVRIDVLYPSLHTCLVSDDPALGCDWFLAMPQCTQRTDEDCYTNPDGTCSEAILYIDCLTEDELVDPPALFSVNLEPQIDIGWDRTCTSDVENAQCSFVGRTCPAGEEVIFHEGNAIPLDCAQYVDEYTCTSDTYASDCDVFTDASCSLIDANCILTNDDGTCLNWSDTYECGAEVEGSFDTECDAVTVCVGDVCQSIENESNDSFAESIAHVSMVNDMVKNNDVTDQSWFMYFFSNEDDLKLFNGEIKQCGRAIFGSVNCCKDTGWALGSLAQCNTQEIELYAAMEAGRTVFINEYCSASFIICTVKKRRYCVYGSKLARVVSTEVFRVNGWEYECRALTYAELQSVDFSQLDLSDVYGDLVASSALPNPNDLVDALADNILATQPVLEETYGE